jgi:hypothetical protein
MKNETTKYSLSREDRDRFVTLGLDAAIKRAEAEVARLRTLKLSLSKTPPPIATRHKKQIIDKAAKMWRAHKEKKRPKNQQPTASIMEAILRKDGPLTPPELTQRMLASGWITSSQRPREVVYQMARVDNRFTISVEGAGNKRVATISLTPNTEELQDAAAENVERL